MGHIVPKATKVLNTRMEVFVDKQDLLNQFIAALKEELAVINQSAKGAAEEAQASDSVPDSQLDNRALEAKRLAEVQNSRAAQAEKRIAMFENMPAKQFSQDSSVDLGALVKVKHGKDALCFFLAPQGAGITVDFDGETVEVITTQSPLGEALLDCQVGDKAVVETPSGEQIYEIISVH